MKVSNYTGEGRFIFYEMQDFINVLNRNPIPGRESASITGDRSFTGTNSYEEALRFMRFGDDESYKLLKQVRKENHIDEMENSIRKRKRLINDVAGFQPIVPNAILGLPKSMLNSNYDISKKKIVRIFFDATIRWSVSSREMALAGAKIMSYIDTLEYNDYRVELYIGNTDHLDEGTEIPNQGWCVPIKSSDQSLNIRKLAFYFINPSFLRRIGFRISEAEENMVDTTHWDYGSTSNTEDRARMVFSALGDDINYYGFDVLADKEFTTDIDEIKEQMGIK